MPGVSNMLARDPSLVHSVVRGTSLLGPGAEFMSSDEYF